MPLSRTRKLIWFFIGLSALALALISFSSILGITELVYPIRIDSAYVKAVNQKKLNKAELQDSLRSRPFFYKPEQLDLKYEPFRVTASDSIHLNGWYFEPLSEETGITLLLIHDIRESKLSYLETARAFTERGFRVCAMDMRACGESEGSYFTMGVLSASDISIILDSLYCRPETRYTGILGVGTGAAIAIHTLSFDKRPVALVVQNSFASLTAYFSRYAHKKWGVLGSWFFPWMKKELDKQMGFNSDSLNLQDKISRITTPTLFIAKAGESLDDLKETHLLFETSPAEKKEFIFFRGADESDQEKKQYIDRISAFINTAVPKKAKPTRFRKLVSNDHPLHH